jgi:hypothetical protein
LVDAVKATGKSVAVAGKSSLAAACAEQPSDFLSAVAQFTQSAVKGALQVSTQVCPSVDAPLLRRAGAIHRLAATANAGGD